MMNKNNVTPNPYKLGANPLALLSLFAPIVFVSVNSNRKNEMLRN